jgi:hypothetical protein
LEQSSGGSNPLFRTNLQFARENRAAAAVLLTASDLRFVYQSAATVQSIDRANDCSDSSPTKRHQCRQLSFVGLGCDCAKYCTACRADDESSQCETPHLAFRHSVEAPHLGPPDVYRSPCYGHGEMVGVCTQEFALLDHSIGRLDSHRNTRAKSNDGRPVRNRRGDHDREKSNPAPDGQWKARKQRLLKRNARV